MKLIRFGVLMLALPALLASYPTPAPAQSSAAELLEQARARSRDLEELKAVLNGPDQNMRLATFDVMVRSGDEAMREVAIDLGMASADPLLQGMALKETILSLNMLIFDLEVDSSQPQSIQDKAQQILQSKGATYQLPINDADRDAGTFRTKSKPGGQVSGTTLTFQSGYDKGQFELADERTLKGTLMIYQSGNGGFIATTRIR